MKYIITGSLGHISNPVVKALKNAGHDVTVISSSEDRKAGIEALMATAAIGSLTDEKFIGRTFSGADAVYLMIPPNYIVPDFPAYQKQVADNYVAALKNSSVKYVVVLSSIGAHLGEGAGPIDGLSYLETQLRSLSKQNIKVLRPSFFYYNLLGMAGLLKTAGIIGSNFGNGNEKLVLVHHNDIADRVTHHLLQHDFTGQSVEYVSSDEQHVSDIAKLLGETVGKPGTQWVSFEDEQAFAAMTQQGLNNSLANEYVEMGKGIRDGKVQEDYWNNQPKAKGSVKLEAFAKEFATVYNSL